MSGYQIDELAFDGHAALRLRAPDGTQVVLARRGATVLSIRVPGEQGMHELADSYVDGADFDSLKGSRFAIMAPFANRIDKARYRFGGKTYDMQPGVDEGKRAIRHGFVRDALFELESTQADAEQAKVVLRFDGIRPGAFDGYPFAIDLRVSFTLREGALSLSVDMHNTGDESAPCFFGWHPYLRPGSTPVDSWVLAVPAEKGVRTDEALLPLPGEAAYVALDDWPERDYRGGDVIGERHIDAGFVDLIPDAEGCVRSQLTDPASGRSITMWQHSGVALMFTGDTLSRDPRTSVAMEPMQSMTNAFNREDCVDEITLAAGARHVYHCGLAWSGGQ